MKQLILPAAVACITLIATPVSAETSPNGSATADQLTSAQVVVAPNCDTSPFPVPAGPAGLTAPDPPVSNAPAAGGQLPVALVPVVAGLLGDVASSGLKALASGLAAASRERTFGGEGVDVFQFYQKAGPRLNSRVTDNGAGCLLVLITPSDAKGVAFAARMRLETLSNGFRIVPHELRYLRSLPGAPSRALPMEFHAIFSVPAKAETAEGDQSVFAVARVRLPAMRPGDVLLSDQLVGFSSQAMLVRPAPTEQVSEGTQTGTTSVVARIVLLKNANRFGQTLSEAMGARAASAGSAVDQAVQRGLYPQGFGEADAALAVAMVTVRQKQAAVDAANSAGDQVAATAAALALAQAQADADVKAAAAKRPLPFPELLN